jgi:hypothetical protein
LTAFHAVEKMFSQATSGNGNKVKRQLPVATPPESLLKLLFVRCENLDAFSSARDGDIPLLCIARPTHD